MNNRRVTKTSARKQKEPDNKYVYLITEEVSNNIIVGKHTMFYFFSDALLSVKVYKEKNIAGNNAKGRISKSMFQQNKARQIFRKTSTSYPLIRTRKCSFFGKLFSFVFLKHQL